MRIYRRLSRPYAFAVALIGAPLIVAAIGGVMTLVGGAIGSEYLEGPGFIILMSLPFGGLSYLVAGGVLFWRAAARGKRMALDYLFAGFIANFAAGAASIPLLAVGSIAFGFLGSAGELIGVSLLVHAFGLLFAPIFGLLFGLIYTRLSADLEPDGALDEEEVAAVFR